MRFFAHLSFAKHNCVLALLCFVIILSGCTDSATKAKIKRLDSLQQVINFTQEKLYKVTADSLSGNKQNEMLFSKLEWDLAESRKAFYNTFDVREVPDFNSLPLDVQPFGRSVCALIPKRLLREQNGMFILEASPLRDCIIREYGLKVCNNVQFSNEVNPSCGTAWAFKNDLIVTADHCCMNKETADSLYFVFEFLQTERRALIKPENVFTALDVVQKKNEDANLQFSIIRLNKKVPAPLFDYLDRNTAKQGDALYMLGHPLGLPLKFTNHGMIYSVTSNTLSTDLDAFKGNSGSPVFNEETNKVIGILIKGQTDFTMDVSGKCVIYKQHRTDKPFKGEVVLKISDQLTKY